MSCRKIEKWISDSMDKEISGRKKLLIEEHVKDCSSCRSFRDTILRIEDEVKNLEMTDVSSAYFQEFSTRLKSRLLSLKGEEKKESPPFIKPQWVLTASAFVMAIVIGIVILLSLPKKIQEEEFYAFSFDKAVEEVYREIGDDIQLDQAFNSLILTSINDLLSPSGWAEMQRPEDDLFLWENLTDEELTFLESEIKKK